MRFTRFRLRTLLTVVTLAAVWLGWLVHQAQRQRRAVAALRACGLRVSYDFQDDPAADGAIHRWIRGWAGDDLLHDATYAAVLCDSWIKPRLKDAVEPLIELPSLRRLEIHMLFDPVSADEFAGLAELKQLEHLVIYSPHLCDRGLSHLGRLARLQTLEIDYSSVTAEGIDRLQAALPNCQITW